MSDIITLAENKFELYPAGEVVMKIKSIEAKPKAKPVVIEVTFQDVEGKTINHRYDLKVRGGHIGFSILARNILGNIQNISASEDLPKMKDSLVKCLVEHREGSKGGVFANITKTIKATDDECDWFTDYDTMKEEEEEEEDDL